MAALLALAACTARLSTAEGRADSDDERESAVRMTDSPGLRRLTRAEYVRTLESLLGVAVDAQRVPRELLVRGHSQMGYAQRTGYGDLEAYYSVGLNAAEQAAPAVLAELECTDAACVREWLAAFLPRALRVPVSPEVLAEYASLLEDPEAGAALVDRFVTVLTAVLTSPTLLYKQEIGRTPPVEGRAHLAAHEIATRLSYLVWQSEPDEALLTLGDELDDPEVRLRELERMLEDERARTGLRHFVLDWMGVFDDQIPRKDVEVLAGLEPTLAQSARRSFELLLDSELFEPERGRFTGLLTTDRVFLDAALAPLYDVSDAGAGFRESVIDRPERRGILAHPLVISAHSKESGASPFPIGKFVFENLLCETIPPPPAGIPPVPEDTASDRTLRQRLEAATADEPCSGCHERIGPPGFAFLPFDPVGRFQALDGAGRPFDTKGELVLPGREAPVPFDGAGELARVLAADPTVAECVARRLFRWTYGRFEGTQDDSAVADLASASVETNTAVAQLLRVLVASPAFVEVRRAP